MIHITREQIKQMASSDTVYYRGMRYYANHSVSNVTWSETGRQYRSLVSGSNQYIVTVDIEEDEELSYSCNCPAHIKYAGACKHVVATLLFISDYNQREWVKSSLSEEDRNAYQIIEYFHKNEYKQMGKEVYHLQIQIQIDSLLHKGRERARVSFQAGKDKMYKIANLKKFLTDLYYHVPIRLGKEFRFTHGECKFDSLSAGVLSYLLEIYEIQEVLGKSYYSNLFSKGEILLTQGMFVKFLQSMEGMECRLRLNNREIYPVRVIKGNPNCRLELAVQDDAVILREGEVEHLLPVCADGTIMYSNHGLYIPEAEFVWGILPFYSNMSEKGKQEISFRKENMGAFLEVVLPQIRKYFDMDIPAVLQERYITSELEAKLYLDMEMRRGKNCIVAKPVFGYGQYEVGPFGDNPPPGNVVLLRNKEREQALLAMLEDRHFGLANGYYILKDETAVFEFLKYGLPEVSKAYTVFYSEDFKKKQLRETPYGEFQVSVKPSAGLLQMDVKFDGIPKEELLAFFRAIRMKKKYYRLQSGAFIDLENRNGTVGQLARILEQSGEVSGNALYFSGNRAFYLEHILPEMENIRVNRTASFEKLVDAIKYPECARYGIPRGVKAKSRDYQKVGYRWLRSLADASLGGILADDMGLGKTLQAILYIAGKKEERTLIVCPTSVMLNWQEEFDCFAPDISKALICGTQAERKETIESRGAQVYITSYPLLRKDIRLYREMEFDTMFIDEAQYIKNASSLSARTVKSIRAKHRFALTGTPLENSLSELWSIFDFVMPGYLPKYKHFMEMYEKPIEKEQDKAVTEELSWRIKPFILRRLKKDVLEELPEKIETKLRCPMTAKQEKLYRNYLARVQKEMQDALAENGEADRMDVLTALTRLRQICCHPGTFVENYMGGSGKLDVLMELIADLRRGNHRILLFSQFTTMLGFIRDALDAQGISSFYLDGSVTAGERSKMIRAFNGGEREVFLISLKAGGTGVNLTGADTVIHYDPWWNPAVENQATDRAHRIGQKHTVHVFKLVTEGTIEEKIYQLQKIKQKLSERVIESGEVFLNQLSFEELTKLLSEEDLENPPE